MRQRIRLITDINPDTGEVRVGTTFNAELPELADLFNQLVEVHRELIERKRN